MVTVVETKAKVDKTVVNMDRFDLFLNGAVDVQVPTGGGSVPTLATLVGRLQGLRGFTPVFALTYDDDRVVMQVIDWTGGLGTKPPIGQYLGQTGLVTTLADAVDLRGQKGDSFTVNATGTRAQRDQYDGQPVPYSFFATDTGLLYFRKAGGGWTDGTPFGKGDKGDPGPAYDPGFTPARADGQVFTGDLSVNKGAGTFRNYDFRTAGLRRWAVAADNAAETGANAGSDWVLSRFADDGSLIDSPLKVSRKDGRLVLSADPTTAMGAATRQFVETQVSDQVATRARRSGDTFTGDIGVSKAAGTNRSLYWWSGNKARWVAYTDLTTEAGAEVGSDWRLGRHDDNGVFIDSPLMVSRKTGLLTLTGDPTTALGAATRRFVETVAEGKANRTGDTFTGDLTFSRAAGTNRVLAWSTETKRRWTVYADSSTEDSSNAGSDWRLGRYDNNGGFLDNPLVVSRASGKVSAGTIGLLDQAFRDTLTPNTPLPPTESVARFQSIHPIGGVGVLGASETRVSQNVGGQSTAGGTFYGINNNPSFAMNSYGIYVEGRRTAGVNGVAHGAEFAIVNTGSVVDSTPYESNPNGMTCAIHMSCGRSDVTGSTHASAAMVVYKGIAGTGKFRRGIVFDFESVETDPGHAGAGDALALPKNYNVSWYDSNGGFRTGTLSGFAARFRSRSNTDSYLIESYRERAGGGDTVVGDALLRVEGYQVTSGADERRAYMHFRKQGPARASAVLGAFNASSQFVEVSLNGEADNSFAPNSSALIDLGAPGRGWRGGYMQTVYFASSVSMTSGIGAPEGAVTAQQGSIYLRRGGGAGTTLYVKESGDGATGWVAK